MSLNFVARGLCLFVLAAAVPAFAAPQASRAAAPAFQGDDALGAIIAGPQRSAANKARDPWRHPDESLNFWGLKPGATVVELYPGGGYWTEILAPYLKRTGGRYVAAISGDPTRFREKFADAAVYGEVTTIPMSRESGPYAPAGTVDLVITARNIHSFMGGGTLDKVMADSFAALKPGGYFAVEEHRSDPRLMVEGAKDGYVSEDHVIAAAEKAGFKLDARSEVNANPKDTKDHPFGVWTLAPSKRTSPAGQPANPDFDRSKYDAIGESDRMTLRFRKPA